MSEVKVNKISPRTNCGTVQLGDSGDTITIPAGATIVNNGTQTGFGRTGTVDWDTTAKTASFTAVSGNGYFVNTTSGAITVTLPATPSAGDIVSVKDYAYTFATNNLTVARNGSPIGGGTGDNPVYATNGTVLTFIYVDGTKGWLVTNESTDTSEAITNTFITATGGTITTCGDYKIHTFTSPGTFCVSAAEGPVAVADYMVVAGGGGGGGSEGGSWGGAAGGGAGGFRESYCSTTSGCYSASPLATPISLNITVQGYPVTIGAGGTAGPGPSGPSNGSGGKGSNSIFSTITSAGGGGGAGSTPAKGPCAQRDGGSGGGGQSGTPYSPGSGNTPPVSPPQGNNGGTGIGCANAYALGGGGGATQAGVSPPGPNNGSNGGAGATTNIPGSPISKSGGGGSGAAAGNPGGTGGTGGGAPGASGPANGPSASANTGGGGGGSAGSNSSALNGGAGGSGIVVIRYKYQ
jgi:hypothetical protein